MSPTHVSDQTGYRYESEKDPVVIDLIFILYSLLYKPLQLLQLMVRKWNVITLRRANS